MKVVIDTNIFLVSIPVHSKYRPILDAFSKRKYTLIVTTDIYFEYIEVLDKLSAKGVTRYIEDALTVARNVINPEIYYYWNLITVDSDDNKFTDAYIAAGSDYLVTNDAHFNEVKKVTFPPVNIISADEFLEILKGLNE
ncbi:MAG: putative toxin-antitoxin system toxin component, family [Segetibacter sp.]|nr:putative toxin-antitoxin system toxin component, family [Segetibacter sp.]